jgi:hypothetical protein
MATLTNIAKHRFIAATGGEVFFGWLFWFTRTTLATGPTLANISKHSGTLTNIAKHSGTLTNLAKH